MRNEKAPVTRKHPPKKSDFIRMILLFLACAGLGGCSTLHEKPRIPQRGSLILHEHISPNSLLALRFDYGRYSDNPRLYRPCNYKLVDKASGTVLAYAVSGISPSTLSTTTGRLEDGIQYVAFAPDSSGVIITEEYGDASTEMRHILMSRTSAGRFAVRYLHPPWSKFTWDIQVPIQKEGPIATNLLDDYITLYYPYSKTTLTLWTGGVESTTQPSSSWDGMSAFSQ